MENLKRFFNKTGWISILESVIIAILGLILICNPQGTVKVISCILGIIFIIAGLFKILDYFASEHKSDIYNYSLIYGLIAIILGIITIVYSGAIGSIFRIIIGVWIIYSAFLRISSSINLKRLGVAAWVYSLVLAIIMFIVGLFITFNSGAIVVTIGWMMIVYALVDIIEDLIFMRNVNNDL